MRNNWHRYFMNIAQQVATRATCDRKHVGTVLVRDHIILSTGYNGSIRGLPHCDEIGHMMEENHCIRTVHSESNAIAQAARLGTSTLGATAYVTASPCWTCFKLLVNAGITSIIYAEFYKDDRIFETSDYLGLKLYNFPDNFLEPVSMKYYKHEV